MNYSWAKTAPIVVHNQHSAAVSVQVVDEVGYSLKFQFLTTWPEMTYGLGMWPLTSLTSEASFDHVDALMTYV